MDSLLVSGQSTQQKRIYLIKERIENIILSLPKAEGISGALIEIKPKNKFFPSESDPKLALRIGAMRSGYVNQHINSLTNLTKEGKEYNTKNAQIRVQRSVSDLLRHLGILPLPLIDAEKDGIEPNLWLTCFYVLRRTRKTTATNRPSTVALTIRVNPITGTVQMTTPSWFLDRGWVSYPIGLGDLIQEKWEPNSYADTTIEENNEEPFSKDRENEQNLLDRFVVDCLRDCLNTPVQKDILPRVLFMAEAQNARKILPWLQNPKLPANDLPDTLKREMTRSEIDRLWMVRLRVADNGEVPVGIVKGCPGSRTSSVFRWQGVCDKGNHPLYFSVRKLLVTEQNTLRKLESRLDNGEPPAANPRFLEIAIIHCPGIDDDKLADFVHHLRSRWPYFANEVSLPLPFPFASSAKEYAVSAKDTDES
ncbi:MAG: RNaseH domain-containing protein, partial [Geitlerinemataceae cyanobacterium]